MSYIEATLMDKLRQIFNLILMLNQTYEFLAIHIKTTIWAKISAAILACLFPKFQGRRYNNQHLKNHLNRMGAIRSKTIFECDG